MKYIYTMLILAVLALVTPAFAQQAETVQVDVTKLSQQELIVYQQLKQRQAQAQNSMSVANLTPETIDRYAQIGKSFGTAFKECWTTVSTDAERFANSSAGKWAMVMVTWKIMGDDAINLVEKSVQYLVGIPLLLAGTLIFAWLIRRNCMERPALVSATKVGWLTVKREYKGVERPVWGGEEAAVCTIFFIIFGALCCAVIFVG